MKLIKLGESLYLAKVEMNSSEISKSKLKYQMYWKQIEFDCEIKSHEGFPVTDSFALLNSRPEKVEELTEVPLSVLIRIIYDLYTRGYNTSVEKIINFIGDERLIKEYHEPGELNDFKGLLLSVLHDEENSSNKTKITPKNDDKYLFDLLNYLSSHETLISFQEYSRVTSPTEVNVMTSEDKKRILEAIDSNSKDKLEAIWKELDDRTVKQVYNSKLIKVGPICYNSNLCNVNIRSRRDVTLTLPKNEFGITTVQSKVLREYNIIRNGEITNKVINVYIEDTDEAMNFRREFKNYLTGGPSIVVENNISYYVVAVDLTKFLILKSGTIKPWTYSKLAQVIYEIKGLGYLLWEYNKKNPHEVEVTDDPKYNYLRSLGIEGHNGLYIPKQVIKQDEGKSIEVVKYITDLTKSDSTPDRAKIAEKLDSGKKLTPKEVMVNNLTPLRNEEEYKLAKNRKDKLSNELSELKVKLMLTKQKFIDDGVEEYIGMGLKVEFTTSVINY